MRVNEEKENLSTYMWIATYACLCALDLYKHLHLCLLLVLSQMVEADQWSWNQSSEGCSHRGQYGAEGTCSYTSSFFFFWIFSELETQNVQNFALGAGLNIKIFLRGQETRVVCANGYTGENSLGSWQIERIREVLLAAFGKVERIFMHSNK